MQQSKCQTQSVCNNAFMLVLQLYLPRFDLVQILTMMSATQ